MAVQANQWLVAKSGGLEVIASAMRGWREYPMVQLCALLCMVPLALDNTVLQVWPMPKLCFQYAENLPFSTLASF